MTLAGFPQSAPSGLAGISANGLVSSGTSMANAIHFPSGDQVILVGDFCTLVTLAVWPVSSQRTKIWTEPSALDAYSNRLPSGDQRGEKSLALPLVRGRRSLPSKSTIQRLDRFLSFMMSLKFRTNATFLPSGEICGSDAVSRSNRSSNRKNFSGGAAGLSEAMPGDGTNKTNPRARMQGIIFIERWRRVMTANVNRVKTPGGADDPICAARCSRSGTAEKHPTTGPLVSAPAFGVRREAKRHAALDSASVARMRSALPQPSRSENMADLTLGLVIQGCNHVRFRLIACSRRRITSGWG